MPWRCRCCCRSESRRCRHARFGCRSSTEILRGSAIERAGWGSPAVFEPCWACTPPTEKASKSARIKRIYLTMGNAAPGSTFDSRVLYRASLHMAEAVKPYVSAARASHHQMAKKAAQGCRTRRRLDPLRSHLIALSLLAATVSGLGCASQDPAARAAEHAAQESEDDATCRQKGAEDSKAYD